MYTKLLMRQIKNHLNGGNNIPAEWKSLLDAINRSYEHYERDNFLGKHSLEISSEELNESTLNLADNQKKLQAILQAAQDGILVINERNEIEICNAAAAAILELPTQEDLVGKDISILNHLYISKDPNKELMKFSNLFSPLFHNLYECYINYKNNSPLPIEVSFSIASQSSQELRICLIRNIAKRKQIEKILALRHKTTRLLLEHAKINEAIPKLLSEFVEDLNYDAAIFWMENTDKEGLKPSQVYYKDEIPNFDAFKKKTFELFPDKKNVLDNPMWHTPSPFFIPDLTKCEDFLRINEAIKCGLHSYLRIPIIGNNKFIGLIELFSVQTFSYNEDLLKIILDIGLEIGESLLHEKALQRELDLQKQLVSSARQAGMMQVATSVLHNVGNALNTVNIAASTLKENLSKSELNSLPKIVEIINAHSSDLYNFLTNDSKGQHIFDYLKSLAELLTEEQQKHQKEIILILSNLNHIKNIISMQQPMSSMLGFTEKLKIDEVLSELIGLYSMQFKRNFIEVITDFGGPPEVYLDKSKLLQILENLISNAVDALKENNSGKRTLIFRTYFSQGMAVVEIVDNGFGIEKENLLKIFTYGFTTKKEGHGFGLHSSAMLAKELGGELSAQSEGKNKGAVFTLQLLIKTT